jgi:PTH2 family peptidyl-tRNA hydrolase
MPTHDEVKQVLVIRRDLGMRRGKEIAQGSHAAAAFLIHRVLWAASGSSQTKGTIWDALRINPEQRVWMESGMTTKVVLQAKDEEELLEVERLCKQAGLEVFLIQDAGLTATGEGMKGIPTYTALGIGPTQAEAIDRITGPQGIHPLKLY